MGRFSGKKNCDYRGEQRYGLAGAMRIIDEGAK